MRPEHRYNLATWTLATRTWIVGQVKWRGVPSADDVERFLDKQYPKLKPHQRVYILKHAWPQERRL